MSKIIATTAAVLMSLIAFSQVSEDRKTGEFSKLKASNGVEVLYTVSNTNSIKVEADDTTKMQYIKTEIENGTLAVYVEVGSKNHTSSSKSGKGRNINGVNFKTLKVYVSGKALTSIKASASANVKIQNLNSANRLDIATSSSGNISGSFDADNMTVSVSSSGDFKGKVDAKSITIDASSSGDVSLSGKAKQLTINASSSSDVDLKNLIAEKADVKANSSADVTINVTQSLDADASSSADINYYGNPADVKADKSSSGSVSKK